MEEDNNIFNKKKGKKKKILIISVIVIGILTAISIAAIIYFKSKLNLVKYEPIDKNDLSINNNIYNNISNDLSKDEFSDIVNVAFFGSDSRDINNFEAGRSDSIMIASLNPKNKSIKLISIPRDTYVNVPGYGKTKINHAYAYGKEQLSIKTINSNFGLNISEYVTIDFSGLINIINEVGGVEVTITKDEMDVLNEYLKESYKISNKTYIPLTKYGKVILNGEQALAHSRNRYVGNDFTRASRQRVVLMALFNKISTMDKVKIFSLIDDILKEIKTNINVTEYMGLISSVITNINEYKKNIISVQIPSTNYSSGNTISGVYYFVTDIDKAKEDFITYLYKK
ncbi:MAG: LCP family protein [Clostridia bacterium]|nr:LCP family protein [Clostridia bacterium]